MTHFKNSKKSQRVSKSQSNGFCVMRSISRTLQLRRAILRRKRFQYFFQNDLSSSPSSDEKEEEKKPVSYFRKFLNGDVEAPKIPTMSEIALSGSMCFTGLSSFCLAANYLDHIHQGYIVLLGSFGATCVLIFGVHGAPFSQPRNVICGHTLSAFIGAGTHALIGTHVLAGPAAVAMSLMVMQATNTLHPPAGGTALITILGGPKIQALGLALPLPVGAGAITLVLLGSVVNNAIPSRKYPIGRWF